ncbi:response regulator [Siminovitchia acidinfaciens]|uniref:Response regulator n=1 Tax=Siminovitchia acidinfaciens TaxID=2321395 RepID=A0A429XZ87_9BACI|nr:response regulator [Siminovitchia acidinfaciens]RST74092.1 response regulator [Siminovitchia acidinfaciens]
MDHLTMSSDNTIEEKYMSRLFHVLKAGIDRARVPISAIFLTISDQNQVWDQAEEEITAFLQTKIRQSDLVFKLEAPFEWCIILTQSGEEEAQAFLQRLFADVRVTLFAQGKLSFSASVAEIGNSDVGLESLIKSGRKSLESALQTGPWQIESINAYKKRKIMKIKVSILEENDIFRNVLQTSLENLQIDSFQLDIKTFQDGYSFLQSDWYVSSHSHIIVMNDILPRKNGLEVLDTIRKLPNNKKFIVFMMTKRNSEEDMIYAYESGVDQYLIKPFNLQLFEAQFRRIFERFWS